MAGVFAEVMYGGYNREEYASIACECTQQARVQTTHMARVDAAVLGITAVTVVCAILFGMWVQLHLSQPPAPSPQPVCVTLTGRRGNRMFQLAMAAALARRRGVAFPPLAALIAGGAFEAEDQTVVCGGGRVAAEDDVTFVEPFTTPSTAVVLPDDVSRFLGYFQDAAYFQDDAETCEEVLQVFGAGAAQLQQRIALHVRGGDYLQYTDIFNILDKAYYERAVTEVWRSGVDLALPLHVFSNDHAHARALLGDTLLGQPLLFVDEGSVQADFDAIASSAAVVCANSTFSWWAGWIASRKHGAQVVVPREWYSVPTISATGITHTDSFLTA